MKYARGLEEKAERKVLARESFTGQVQDNSAAIELGGEMATLGGPGENVDTWISCAPPSHNFVLCESDYKKLFVHHCHSDFIHTRAVQCTCCRTSFRRNNFPSGLVEEK